MSHASAACQETVTELLSGEHMSTVKRITAATALADVLGAEGPVRDRADGIGLYAPFIGSWQMEVIDYDRDGSRRTSKGEWHFAWVLEGRAIQDVFVVPSREERRPEMPTRDNRYGATVRVYDADADEWHLTWFNPVTGARDTLVGRLRGDEIVQEGQNEEGLLKRWSFSEITDESFRWRGEESSDEGKTWRLTAEFFGRRTSHGSPDRAP